MFLARITFVTNSSGGNLDAQKDIAESYLASLLKNGQICGKYLTAWSGGTLNAFTSIARPSSLEERHHSEWSLRELEAVQNAFARSPACEIIDDDIPKTFPKWQTSSNLYLFTHAFVDASPICCGDTGRPIPLYLLPITKEKREALYFWSQSYNYLDNIWFGSGTLEMPAYIQLADPKSELSKKGRELCAAVEQATEVPTFYFMHRYWGRFDGEHVRPCPDCGGKWNQSDIQPSLQLFHQFHFRCQRCRLVSRCADTCDDELKAQLGTLTRQHNNALIRSGEARLVGWSRSMLY